MCNNAYLALKLSSFFDSAHIKYITNIIVAISDALQKQQPIEKENPYHEVSKEFTKKHK